ncbi:MAG: hypothetical protein ACYC5K_02385 [Saccharofermentanales bacterium]
MDEQTIIHAYDTVTLASESLFKAGEKSIDAKDILENARLEALTNGSIVGKNADEREASAKALLKPLYDQLTESQEHERHMRYLFDQATRHLAKVRDLLRLAEITKI